MAGQWLARLTGRSTPRVYLHIGAMKTGTTYLQNLLGANRQQLKDAGLLFPGEFYTDQSHAVREILWTHEDDEVKRRTRGRWKKLVQEIRDYEGGASVVSMEFMSFADTDGAARIIDSFDGLEVHVILTVRDAVKAIPAQWQTSARNGSKMTLPKLVRGARFVLNGKQSPKGRGSYIFQRTQGIPRMLEVWAPLVGPKRMHVITVPPSREDPALLWHRFAEVVKIDPAAATDMPKTSNASLGHPSSEFLRRVNKKLGSVGAVDYWRVVKGQLARYILSQRSEEERPVRLHRPGVALARQWNGVVREAITQHGVRFVGSLDELPVGPPEEGLPKRLYRPTRKELLAAGETAYAGLLDLREEWSTLAELPVPERLTHADWRSAEDPVDAAVSDVVELVRDCMKLRPLLPDPVVDNRDDEDELDEVSRGDRGTRARR